MSDAEGFGKIRFDRTDRLKFSSGTRMSIEVQFDPVIKAALRIREGYEQGYVNRISEPCVRALRAAGRPISIIDMPGRIANDGTNVIIRLTVGPNFKGSPYRVSLFASQGKAHWSASIERPFFRFVPNNIPIGPDRTTGDGRPYWDAGWDTHTLAEHLCNHLLSGVSNASEG